MKLAAEDVPFLRIGRAGQVHPRLHDWMPGGSHHPDTSVRGLRATAQEACVVCPSPLTAHTFLPAHPLISSMLMHGIPCTGCCAQRIKQHSAEC